MIRNLLLMVAAAGASAVTLAGPSRASTASDISGYVERNSSGLSCSSGTVDGRQFVHCRSTPTCGVPNLLFEIRGPVVVWANGKAGTFVEKYPRTPVEIIDSRPLPYTPLDVMKALGCP